MFTEGMKRKLLFVCLILIACGNVEAQKKEKKIELYGQIIDAKTKAGPDSVFLTLLNADSTLIDTTSAKKWESQWQMRASTSYEIKVPAEPKKFIVKAQADGYHTAYVDFEITKVARNRWFELPILKMRPMKAGVPDSVMLDEVVVKATKIKMVTKGDTIIYNADAFPLEEGSMLDALVRQLPGAKLSSDGEITVNGEKVEELTLNGKDFFKGSNKVMLENLPSFTVKNIQVYHKSTKQSQWAGREMEQKKFTMDVQLKRQYNTGFLGNAEVAGGTEDRYMARLFAMRYTDCSRLSTYANINNVNENRKPGNNGDWAPANQPQGERSTRKAGLDLHIDEKESRWEENMSLEWSWNKSFNESETNAEQFLSSRNSFSRSASSSLYHSKNISLSNDISLMKPFWLSSVTNINYTEQNGSSLSRSATSDVSLEQWGSVQSSLDSVFAAQLDPQLQSKLINRNHNRSLSDSKELLASQNLVSLFKLSSGDMVQIESELRYRDVKQNNGNLQQVNYYRMSPGSDIHQNNYNTTPSNRYNYLVRGAYRYAASERLNISARIGYGQEYEMQDRQYHRLDQLDGWGLGSAHEFGELPSTRDSLLMCIDARNSYRGNLMSKTFYTGMNADWQIYNDSIQAYANLQMPVSYKDDRLDYHSTYLTTKVSRHNWFLQPTLYFYYQDLKRNYTLNFYGYLSASAPSLYNMVDKRNDIDPLNVFLGNPDLKNSFTETVYAHFRKTWKGKAEVTNGIHLSWYASQNSVSQGFTFDETTGGYTYKPMNVDGNWSWDASDDVTVGFGKQKRMNFSNTVKYSFAQSVDMAAVQGQSDSGLNKVHTKALSDDMELVYRKDDDLSLGINGSVTYRHSTSDRKGFTDIEATNFSYGFTGTYKVPLLKLTLATDIKMFSRRGYATSDLNTNDLIWNASVTKAFLKKKLTARLEMFDILHQLTNTNITINAQGRTETVTNTLPRYAMLHLQYNFNIMPKMKK